MDIQRNAETELAWMAGFFDGDGNVGIQGSRYKKQGNMCYKLYVSVVNTERDLVEPFKKSFGGSIRVDKRKSVRTSKHDKVRDCYIWRCDARKAERAIGELLCFVKSPRKREQIKLGLEFQSQKYTGRYRANLSMAYHHRQREYYEKMKELHK